MSLSVSIADGRDKDSSNRSSNSLMSKSCDFEATCGACNQSRLGHMHHLAAPEFSFWMCAECDSLWVNIEDIRAKCRNRSSLHSLYGNHDWPLIDEERIVGPWLLGGQPNPKYSEESIRMTSLLIGCHKERLVDASMNCPNCPSQILTHMHHRAAQVLGFWFCEICGSVWIGALEGIERDQR